MLQESTESALAAGAVGTNRSSFAAAAAAATQQRVPDTAGSAGGCVSARLLLLMLLHPGGASAPRRSFRRTRVRFFYSVSSADRVKVEEAKGGEERTERQTPAERVQCVRERESERGGPRAATHLVVGAILAASTAGLISCALYQRAKIKTTPPLHPSPSSSIPPAAAGFISVRCSSSSSSPDLHTDSRGRAQTR